MNAQQDQHYQLEASKQITREPASIFHLLKEAVDEEEKIKFKGLLSELRNVLPEGYKMGAAIRGKDSFFDSVAQALNELKDKGLIESSKRFDIKSLRHHCKRYAWHVNQSEKGFWLENALDVRGERLHDYIPHIEYTAEDIKNANSSKIKTLNFKRAIKGRLDIEGKIICKNFGIKVRVIKLKDEKIDGSHVIKDKVGRGLTIYLVHYKKHFIPLLSNMKKKIKKSFEVSREEVYGSEMYSQLTSIQDNEGSSNVNNSFPNTLDEENCKTNLNFRKRKHSMTNKDVAPKKIRMNSHISNLNSEFCRDLPETSNQRDLYNTCTIKHINHDFLKFMYQLDLSVLCTLRKFNYKDKYPLLSISFEDSKVDDFNNICLLNEGKSVHIQIEYIDKYYTDNDINYVKLFNKGGQSFSIHKHFNSFVKHLISKTNSSLDSIECFVIYTNSGLDLTKENQLRKGKLRNYYPFKFDNINMEEYVILKDMLLTNSNIPECGFYKFSQTKTKEELLKRLEFSSALKKITKNRKKIAERVKELFLDRLVFAINQPNREQLKNIIKRELVKNSNFLHNITTLRQKLLGDLITSGKYKIFGPDIICEFSLLIIFLHNMFLHNSILSLNCESHGIGNDVIVNYQDGIVFLKVHISESNIGYSQLFPSKRLEKNYKLHINTYFALFIEQIDRNKAFKYFIVYTNANLDLTEEKQLKKRNTKSYYPLTFYNINLQEKKYEILRKYPFMNKNGLYGFAKDVTRINVLHLLKFPDSFEKESISYQNKQDIKEKFLDKLVFATNQPTGAELNNTMTDIDEFAIGYNYEELHEIALRWLESHKFSHITKEIMGIFLKDIKNNRSSYQKLQTNIDEEIRFAESLVGRKGTPIFDEFLEFLISGEGNRYMKVLKKEKISLTNVSSILGGAKGKASAIFKDLYDLWFDDEGNKTFYLKTIEKEGVNLSNISSILNKAKGKASIAFKDLFNLWFDENGNKTQYLKILEKEEVNLASISSILSGARAKASIAFKDLYDLWFDEDGNKTSYLKTLQDEKINLSNVSSILSGAGPNAAIAFKELYSLWFDIDGNKTDYLKILEQEKIYLTNIASILSGSGPNAAKAFKGLYDLWFDESGTKTQYLNTLEEQGIDLTNMSSILHGVGTNASTAFKSLYNIWFDEYGNKSQYLKTLEDEGINLSNISSILHGVGSKAAIAFKDLYDLWFDESGNKTKYLKTLEDEAISLANISNILHGAGNNAASAFQNLHSLWFEVNGNKTHYIKVLEENGISLTNMSSILGGSGINILIAFKELYELWFDEDGNKTHYLQTLDKEGVGLASVASILGGSGVNAARAFKDIYDLWFVENEHKIKYLETLKKEKINIANISSILHGAGLNAARAFKNLYGLWFDEKGNKSRYLKTLEEEGISLANMSSILNGAGANAAPAFQNLYDLWFDKEGNKTLYLKILEKDRINLPHISSILHGAGDNASRAFRELFNAFFDDKGNRKKHLKHFFIEGKGKGKSFKLSNLSCVLSRTGNRATYAFENLHMVCFDDKGNTTKLLNDFYKAGFKPSNLSSILYGSGTHASSNLKRLHSVCFNENGEITELLDDFYKIGFKPGNLCSMLSGSTNNLVKNLRKFHNFCFIDDSRIYLNHFLAAEHSFTLSNLSKILHGAGANICTVLKRFHDICFDETGSITELLSDFYTLGFTPINISNILSMAGNNATFILRNFHKACFNKENYLHHFLAEKKVFTPKVLSKILHGIGIEVYSVFKRLHNLCFDEEGNKTNYLYKIIKTDPYNICDVLHDQVKKAPPIFLC